jgi:hypothetical protein
MILIFVPVPEPQYKVRLANSAGSLHLRTKTTERFIKDCFLFATGAYSSSQGCGSGLDPDSMTLWIKILNPDPNPGTRK